jgi:hypothetical protein
VTKFDIRLVGLNNSDIEQWIGLIDTIINKIATPRVDVLENALLAAARTTPISEITNEPIIQHVAPSPDKAATQRK